MRKKWLKFIGALLVVFVFLIVVKHQGTTQDRLENEQVHSAEGGLAKPKIGNERKNLVSLSEKPHRSDARKSSDHSVLPSRRHTTDAGSDKLAPTASQSQWADRLGVHRLSPVARHMAKLDALERIDSKILFDKVSRRKILSFLVRELDGDRRLILVRHAKAATSSERDRVRIMIGDELVVRFKEKLSPSELDNLAKMSGVELVKSLSAKNSYLFRLQNSSIDQFELSISRFAKNSQVLYAHENDVVYPTAAPDDPLFAKLWGLQNNGQKPYEESPTNYVADQDMGPDSLWGHTTDCSNVTIAVIDTGVDPQHPDLMANLDVDKSRNFTSNDATDFIDTEGHGTHVAGTIGAVGNNGVGITGVCWKAKMVAVKVLGPNGGSIAQVTDGMIYAAGVAGAKVLNLSLGGPPGADPSPLEVDVIQRVADLGALMIMAAGNDGTDSDQLPSYPAAHPNEAIISVAAVGGDGGLAEFSNYGTVSVDIAAPGVETLSTIPPSVMDALGPFLVAPNQPYAYFQGTSMATPHVAGAVALFWSFAPELSPQQVKEVILSRSRVDPDLQNFVGGGRVLNLEAIEEEVLASLKIDLPVRERVILSDSSRSLSLEITEKLAAIEKIEVLVDGQVIDAYPGTSRSIDLPFNLRGLNQGFLVRLTDAQGRVVEQDLSDSGVDVEKQPNFSGLLSEDQKGDILCRVFDKALEGQAGKLIFEAGVANDQVCRSVCVSIGPMVYSSSRRVECGTGDKVYYSRSP